MLCLAAAVASLVAVVGPAAPASASTAQFHGVNWADPRDNYATDAVVPTGLSTSDDYATTKAKATAILKGFAADGVNTVRLPINPPSVSGSWWASYQGAIDAATAQGMTVILGYWEAPPQDGKVDDTASWYSMWDTVVAAYGSSSNVLFEPMNEPYGYSLTDWSNLVAQWIGRYSSLARNRIVVSGTGYDQDVTGVCADSRLSGTYLALHDYGFWATHDYAGWVNTVKAGVGSCASRTILDEFGAPMTTGLDYSSANSTGNSSNDNFVAYMQAMANTTRSLGMGSVLWPGLRSGDSYSLTTLSGSGTSLSLTVNNPSGLALLRTAWGLNGTQLVGAQSGRCLDVVGASRANTAGVDIYDCNGGVNQIWQATAAKELRVYGNKCLDVTSASTAAGAPVGIYDCNGGTNQQWTLASNGTITSVSSGQCLDVVKAATANGSTLEIWPCNGGSNQQWSQQ